MVLATTSELETQLGANWDGAQLLRAEQALELASGVVEAYCGRTFTRTETDVTVDADPVGRTVVLDNPPIDVTSITLDGVAVDDYVVYEDAGIVLLPSTYSAWGRVQVTYSHGLDGAPAAVKAVVLAVAGRLILNADGVTQKSVGDVSVSYGSASTGPALSPLEQQALSAFRLTGVG